MMDDKVLFMAQAAINRAGRGRVSPSFGKPSDPVERAKAFVAGSTESEYWRLLRVIDMYAINMTDHVAGPRIESARAANRKAVKQIYDEFPDMFDRLQREEPQRYEIAKRMLPR